jgi:RNA polymerase sigma-70 factor (ECF subfamily)
MSDAPPVTAAGVRSNERFATTRWSLICAAATPVDPRSKAALAALCESYWYPLYAFVRRRGHDADDATDLTQAFFATLLEKNYLADADRTRGRFRTFLLASLKHFLCNEADRAARLKRGGGRTIVSFDAEDAEARYRLEPSHEMTAERLFDRRWALLLLEHVLIGLRADYEADGKVALFDALKPALTFAPGAGDYSDMAAAAGVSEGAARVAVHRLRKRYRERLRETIADGAESAAEIDQEIRELFEALSTRPPG